MFKRRNSHSLITADASHDCLRAQKFKPMHFAFLTLLMAYFVRYGFMEILWLVFIQSRSGFSTKSAHWAKNSQFNQLATRISWVTGEFPAQMVSNAENVSIWWRHHVSSRTLDQIDTFSEENMMYDYQFYQWRNGNFRSLDQRPRRRVYPIFRGLQRQAISILDAHSRFVFLDQF